MPAYRWWRAVQTSGGPYGGEHAMDVAALKHLPASSLLQTYAQKRAYTDAYRLDLHVAVSLAEFIDAFYTTWLFKLERRVLATLVAKSSSDAQAAALAAGERTKFAAWTVEARADDQIVMCDYMSKTRSWLMCVPGETGGTSLSFGSAIVPERILPDGRVDLGFEFHLLLGFHKLYSVALLKAAGQSLLKRHGRTKRAVTD